MLAPAELKQVHPLGKSPVVTIESPDLSKTLVLAESGLIVEYITEHFAEGTHMIPTKWQEGKEGKIGGEQEMWLRWRYIMHYAEGTLMPLLVLGLIIGRMCSSISNHFHIPVR